MTREERDAKIMELQMMNSLESQIKGMAIEYENNFPNREVDRIYVYDNFEVAIYFKSKEDKVEEDGES